MSINDMIIFSVLGASLLLFALGRRLGLMEGKRRGMAERDIEIRRCGYLSGKCPICKQSVQDLGQDIANYMDCL